MFVREREIPINFCESNQICLVVAVATICISLVSGLVLAGATWLALVRLRGEFIREETIEERGMEEEKSSRRLLISALTSCEIQSLALTHFDRQRERRLSWFRAPSERQSVRIADCTG